MECGKGLAIHTELFKKWLFLSICINYRECQLFWILQDIHKLYYLCIVLISGKYCQIALIKPDYKEAHIGAGEMAQCAIVLTVKTFRPKFRAQYSCKKLDIATCVPHVLDYF